MIYYIETVRTRYPGVDEWTKKKMVKTLCQKCRDCGRKKISKQAENKEDEEEEEEADYMSTKL